MCRKDPVDQLKYLWDRGKKIIWEQLNGRKDFLLSGGTCLLEVVSRPKIWVSVWLCLTNHSFECKGSGRPQTREGGKPQTGWGSRSHHCCVWYWHKLPAQVTGGVSANTDEVAQEDACDSQHHLLDSNVHPDSFLSKTYPISEIPVKLSYKQLQLTAVVHIMCNN